MINDLEELRQVWFFDVAFNQVNEEEIYFVSGWFNALIKANITTGNGECIKKLDDEIMEKMFLSRSLLCIQNKILIIPYNAMYIYIYDMETNALEKMVISEDELLEKNYKFFTGFQYQNNIYLIPLYFPYLVQLDFLERKSVRCMDLSQLFAGKQISKLGIAFQYTTKGYVLLENQTQWGIIDLESGKIHVKTFDIGQIVSASSAYANKVVVLTSNAELYEIDLQKEDTKLVQKIDKNIVFTEYPFIEYFNDKVFVFSQHQNIIVIIDVSTGGIKIIAETEECEYKNSLWRYWKWNWLFAKVYDNGVVAFNARNNSIYFFDQTGKIRKKTNIKLKELPEDVRLYMPCYRQSSEAYYYPYNRLESLIELMTLDDEIKESSLVD